MNKLILDKLKEITVPPYIPQILPHQLATLDFLYEKCINEHKSVLMFHKMGSGKTIISLLFAILASNYSKVLIILPSFSILEMWKYSLYNAFVLLPMKAYNINRIEFITRSKLIDEIMGNNKDINDIVIENMNKYNNCIAFIDEAHNYFGNFSGNLLISMSKHVNIIYILLTGSPISNTIESIKDIVEILTNENFEYNKYIESSGNKVFQQKINKKGKALLKSKLYGLISYYDEDRKDIPRAIFQGNMVLFNYPVVLCQMSKLQEDNYNMIVNQTENDMFIKLMMNVSLVALGPKENYTNFETFMNTNQEIFPNFNVLNGKFVGSELITLNISSKLKYFMRSILSANKVGKRFIYFANSTIGSTIIRSVMLANGISEYDRETVTNFVCVNCLTKNGCKDSDCVPMKFVIITSKESNRGNNNYINNILSIFNEDINENGSVIMFLFGSRIVAEAYTIKQVKEIWFLTVPETKSELEQCIARAIRSFAYKDTNIKVIIRICIATTSNSITDELTTIIEKYKDKTITIDDKTAILNKFELRLANYANNLPYDLKKQLYAEFKSEKARVAYNIFINLSELSTSKINNIVLECFIIEMLRRYAYLHSRFTLDDINNYICTDIKYDYGNEIINTIKQAVTDGLVVYNKTFGACYLDFFKTDIVVIKITLEFNDYLLSVTY